MAKAKKSKKPDEPKVKVKAARSKKQVEAAERLAAERKRKNDLAQARSKAEKDAAQLAQMVNLVIAGHSFEAIGLALNMEAKEVESRLAADTARFIRTQPALRQWARQWVSEKYSKLLDTNWDVATDIRNKNVFAAQDRSLKVLERMTRLHGAEAPVQTEVKVEAAPEAVDNLVKLLAMGKGLGYDAGIFDADVIDAEVVHEIAEGESTKRKKIEIVLDEEDGDEDA